MLFRSGLLDLRLKIEEYISEISSLTHATAFIPRAGRVQLVFCYRQSLCSFLAHWPLIDANLHWKTLNVGSVR